jgi:hypothetical protein
MRCRAAWWGPCRPRSLGGCWGVVELGRGGPGRFASTLAAEEDVGSPLGCLLGRGKERGAILRLRFYLFLETDLLFHRFLPGRGRRILLMLALALEF